MPVVLAHAGHDHGPNLALIALVAVVLVLAVVGAAAAARKGRRRRIPGRTPWEGSGT
jgi:hypothetical protein